MHREGGRGGFLQGGQQQIVPLPVPALRSFSFQLMTWLFDLLVNTLASFPTPTRWPLWSMGLRQREAESKIHIVLDGE